MGLLGLPHAHALRGREIHLVTVRSRAGRRATFGMALAMLGCGSMATPTMAQSPGSPSVEIEGGGQVAGQDRAGIGFVLALKRARWPVRVVMSYQRFSVDPLDTWTIRPPADSVGIRIDYTDAVAALGIRVSPLSHSLGHVLVTGDVDVGLSMRSARSTSTYTDSTGAVVDRRVDESRLFGPRVEALAGVHWGAVGLVLGPSLSAGVSRNQTGGWGATLLTVWSLRARVAF